MIQNFLFTILVIIVYTSTRADGFYIGIGTGISSINTTPQNGFEFNSNSNGTQITNAPAITTYFGYQYNQFLSAQIEYTTIINTRVANSFELNQRLAGISLLGSIPLNIINKNLSTFAKIGIDYSLINYFNVTSNCQNCSPLPNSSFTYLPLYGIGIDYNISDITIRSELDYSPNNTVSYNNLSTYTTTTNSYLLSIYYKF